MKDLNKTYLLGGVVDRGSRFCSKNTHFLVRNKVYIPYSYLILVLKENNSGKQISVDNYDPDAFY